MAQPDIDGIYERVLQTRLNAYCSALDTIISAECNAPNLGDPTFWEQNANTLCAFSVVLLVGIAVITTGGTAVVAAGTGAALAGYGGAAATALPLLGGWLDYQKKINNDLSEVEHGFNYARIEMTNVVYQLQTTWPTTEEARQIGVKILQYLHKNRPRFDKADSYDRTNRLEQWMMVFLDQLYFLQFPRSAMDSIHTYMDACKKRAQLIYNASYHRKWADMWDCSRGKILDNDSRRDRYRQDLYIGNAWCFDAYWRAGSLVTDQVVEVSPMSPQIVAAALAVDQPPVYRPGLSNVLFECAAMEADKRVKV